MSIFRSTVRASLVTATALALALSVVAALPATAAAPAPVVKLSGRIAPDSHRLAAGTPFTLTLNTRFTSVPPGADLVLQRLDYLFARTAVVNGRLFPWCDAAKLARANGRLSVCPKGSKIGSGTAAGTAIALGVTSGAVITMFNGPGGRSITMNVSITTPALINATFAAPFVTLKGGRWANKLTVVLPDSLRSVLGGDVVTSRIDVTTGATRMVHGVKRGYIEAVRCPKSGKARIHGEFTFNQGAVASADTTVAC
ncbi:MAG TPA: hypothetical protein VFF79_04780 [Conexibacter sp.]|jgi:type 1 fimbria pilin|nr:hypothetical protein [Conexibacter sp.]